MGLFSTAPKPHPNFIELADVVIAKSGRDRNDVNVPKLMSVFAKVFETTARKHVPEHEDEIHAVLMQSFGAHDVETPWRQLQTYGRRGVSASNGIVDWCDANTEELVRRTRAGQYDK
jgi:hypothetical protein